MAGDVPSRSWHPLRRAQLLPQVPAASSQNQGRVTNRNEAGAVSMAAADPVFIHGGEKLQDVPFLEAQVPVSGARVVAQRPNCPAPQMASGTRLPGDPEDPQNLPQHSGGRELGGTRDLLLRQRWHLRRDLCKEPPDRAVLPSRPREWEQGRRCENIRDGTEDMGVRDMWGYRGQGQRGWGREKQPNTIWGGHMPTLLSWTELFRPATAGSQLPYACPKRAAMNPESTQENAKNCPQNVWEKQLIAGGQRLRFPQSQAGGGDPRGCSHGTSGQRCLSLERRVGSPGRV